MTPEESKEKYNKIIDDFKKLFQEPMEVDIEDLISDIEKYLEESEVSLNN